jgi:hypothetical protein
MTRLLVKVELQAFEIVWNFTELKRVIKAHHGQTWWHPNGRINFIIYEFGGVFAVSFGDELGVMEVL